MQRRYRQIITTFSASVSSYLTYLPTYIRRQIFIDAKTNGVATAEHRQATIFASQTQVANNAIYRWGSFSTVKIPRFFFRFC